MPTTKARVRRTPSLYDAETFIKQSDRQEAHP